MAISKIGGYALWDNWDKSLSVSIFSEMLCL